jgi:hypothetical protein
MVNSTDNKKVIDNAKFYTLSAAVYSCLEDIQAGEERFNQFLKWAIDGFQEFHFEAAREIEVGVFEMNPWKQIDYPSNLVAISKVGIQIGNSIATFTIDKNIPKYFNEVDGIKQENTDAPMLDESLLANDLIPFFTDDYFSGSGSYYGKPAQHNYSGYFDLDEKNRVINFKRTVTGQSLIYLEWITDGINPTGRTVIHPHVFKCIQNYIHWQRKEHDDRYGGGEAERARTLYNNSFQDVLVRQLDLSLADISEAARSGAKQTTKG